MPDSPEGLPESPLPLRPNADTPHVSGSAAAREAP